MSAGTDSVVMVVCGVALLAAMAVAQAQNLSDPTRPPAAAESPAAGAEQGAPATGLQAIIRRQGEKPAAIINGEYIELGGRSGDARVIDIGDDTVTLQGTGGRETLLLLPGVDKKPAAGRGSGGKQAGKRRTGEGTNK